jgi:hypothetical protein
MQPMPIADKPGHLAAYIDIALELDSLKECGAVFRLSDLSEGQWLCLQALSEARNSAAREKQAMEATKARMNQ